MKLFSGPPLSQFAAPAAPERADFRLVPIPRLAAGGRWRVEAMRSYSEPLLLWFTRGQGRITVAGVTRGYGAHNAIFIPAGVMHGFEIGHQVHGTALFFGRETDLALPRTPQHLRVRDAIPQGELSSILDAVQREMESSKPGHERAAHHHLGLVGVWLERQLAEAAADPAAAAPARPDAARKLAMRYTALLERKYRSGANVADLAAELGVTATHLTRVCNRTCGRTAHALLADRKMHEARRLLAETPLPVREVSERLGFASPAYFTRAFQGSTGKTPSGFRRQG